MRNYLDSKMPVNLVQYRGTVGVFNNRKFTKKLQYKEISKLKFIHTCFISDHLSLQSHSMVSFFMLLIVFFLLKPKVPKGVKFSAFAMFYVICIYLLSVKWLYKIFLILLSVSGDVEINPGPRRKMKHFQSTTGTWTISLLTSMISCFF